VISGLRREVTEIRALLGYYAASSGCVITQKSTVLNTLLFELWCIQFGRTVISPHPNDFFSLSVFYHQSKHITFNTMHLSTSVQSVVFAVIIKAVIN